MFVDYRKICENRYIRDAESRRIQQAKTDEEIVRALVKFVKTAIAVGPPIIVLLIWVIQYEVHQSLKHMFDGLGPALDLAFRRLSL